MGEMRKLPLVALIPVAATLSIAAAWLAPASLAHGAPDVDVTPTPTLASPPCAPLTEFDPANFSDPTNIDSGWLPLIPGRKLVLKGVTEGRHRRVVFIATDLTKVIDGVRTRVMWHRDYVSGRLREAALAFFAQDDDGNVWNLGEYAEEYETGRFTGAPNTWIAGLADAEAGIHLPAEPEAGGPEYLRGAAPEIGLLECAKVIAMDVGDEFCIPLNCFDGVLVTEERTHSDAGSGHQRTYHVNHVGTVQVTSVDDPEGNTLALIKDVELTASEKLWARQKAFALEERAYEISDVYQDTPPAERLIAPAVAPSQTPQPSPEPTPDPGAGPPEPTPEAASDNESVATSGPPTADLLPTPTPLVAPLRTVPAVALAFQAPRRPPRSGLLPSILPSILPSSGGLPGDELGSIAGLVMVGAGLALMASYVRVYLRPKSVQARTAEIPSRNNAPLSPSSIASARRESLERRERARFEREGGRTSHIKKHPRHE